MVSPSPTDKIVINGYALATAGVDLKDSSSSEGLDDSIYIDKFTETGPQSGSGDPVDMAYYRDISLLVVGSATTIVATAIVAAQCITDIETAEC